MKASAIGVAAAAVLGGLALARVGEARNPHCAGGIQYWQQWSNDKAKKNFDDYRRELKKAIQQLEICSAEDPNDFEALGYLGWCYAEADSAGPAGRAFAKAIEGLNAKGDKKGAERVVTNRDSYWGIAFNEGVAHIGKAQNAYPNFLKKPESPADSALKAGSESEYEQAVVSLRNASLLKPGDPRTLRNLGVAFASRGKYQEAEALIRDGLKASPNDSDLVNAMQLVRYAQAVLLVDSKKFDAAIAIFSELVQAEPSNVNFRMKLGDAHFERAQTLQGDARKPDFKAAAEAYAKAGELSPGNADVPFNAAQAYQAAGEPALAEAQWRLALKYRPQDVDAISSLGATLADLKKYDEAIQILHQGIALDPKNKGLHRQLGGVFTKAGNNPKGTEELMVYLALQNGQPAADPAAELKKVPAGSQAAKTLASAGMPEQVYPWTADTEKYETWFYWSKGQAYHWKGGVLVQKSDWGAPAAKPGTAGAPK